MDFEPILLKAPLTTILDWLALALWAGVVRNILLLEFTGVPLHLLGRHVGGILDFFERTHPILALTDVDQFVG